MDSNTDNKTVNFKHEEKSNLIKRLNQDMIFRAVIVLIGIVIMIIMHLLKIYIEMADIYIVSAVFVFMYLLLKITVFLKKPTIFLKYFFIIFDISLITYMIMNTNGILSPLYILYIAVLLYMGLSLENRNAIKFTIALIALLYLSVLFILDYSNKTKLLELLVIFSIKYLSIFMFGILTLYMVKKLVQQNVALREAFSNNLKLSLKLKAFNHELIDRVLTATSSLENEAALNMELYKKTKQLFLNTTTALISAIDAKDPYTYGHTERMAHVSLVIFDEYCETNNVPGMEKQRQTLELAALLHDIGKIGIHDKVLLKPGSLDESEWEEIRKHPIIGSNILESIQEMQEVREIIEHHHEKYDGKGYVSGLKGEEIPLLSRIIAIADAYDAMTSSRPYRKKMKDFAAVKEIEATAGTHFDPMLVKIFLQAYNSGKLHT